MNPFLQQPSVHVVLSSNGLKVWNQPRTNKLSLQMSGHCLCLPSLILAFAIHFNFTSVFILLSLFSPSIWRLHLSYKNSTNRKLKRLSHQFIWPVLFTDWIQSHTHPIQIETFLKLKHRQNGQSPQLLLGLFLCLGFLQEYPSQLILRLLDQKTLCALWFSALRIFPEVHILGMQSIPFLCEAIAD